MADVIDLACERDRRASNAAHCEGRVEEDRVMVRIGEERVWLTSAQARTWADGLLTLADTADEEVRDENCRHQ